ncbi:hemagglutinin repeat-containing protein, partial [Collimonas silvisoli]|uniref:hemagglutinin repeat-containing protein n=1 Tax=Collimonas silvisoli TaxID=2825884 RepID=UPI001B8B2B58
KDSINLDVAHSFETQGQTNTAKGWSTDNRGSLPVGVFNSNGKGNGSTDTIHGTTLSAGGKATLATTEGDITLTAANLVASSDLSINAARDLTIQSGQDTLTNANQNNSQAIGKVVISDTEHFAGYHSEKNHANDTAITQVASNVGSLQGNVSLSAGDKYTQTASNVLAKNDINIVAKSIDINTAANTGSSDQSSADLKIGAFARVSSPLIDLGNNLENAKKSDGRLQAMQGLAAASNAYQIASAANAVAGGAGSGELLKAEVGVGFASANSKDRSSYSQAQGSSVQGGGNVSLTSTEGDIHATGAHIAAGDAAGKTLTLDSARNILLDAGQSTATSSGSNHSAGVEVGVGYEVGAKTGFYAYATANVGNGNYNNTSTTNSNTQLSGDTVTLTSKGDTTLKGATVKANTINADVGGKLAIESVQDTSVQHNEQSSVGGRIQISFGTAWEASGNVGQSTANGSSNAVNQQSGLFAGNGGYHVTADTVALKGGAIASSNAGKSDLTAKSITFENLTNKMDYSADTVSMSGGVSGGSSNGNSKGEAPAQTSTGASNPNVTPGIPLLESGSASSTTYGTLTDGNITIGGQRMTSAAGLGAHTDLATAHTAIAPLPDLKNVMNNQQAMAAAANTVIATSAQIANDLGTAANKKYDKAQAVLNNKDSTQEQKNQAQQDANDAQAAVKNWGPTGDYTRALKVVTGVLVGGVAGQGAGQIAANASAPYAANAIGDYFAQPGHENQTAQVLTHAVLGAILAAANGGSAAAGAGAGAAGELAAQQISRELYPQAYDADGTFHPEKLDANQINTVISLSTAVGALVAGATGGSALDASVGGNIAANAATNNWLSQKRKGMRLSEQEQFDAAQKRCTETGDCTAARNLAEISALRDANLNTACADRASSACGAAISDARANGNTVIFGNNGHAYAYPTGSPTWQAIADPRQGTYESAQAANLNDALQYAAMDSVTGIALKGIVFGAKAILGGAETLLAGLTKSAAETVLAVPGKAIGQFDMIANPGPLASMPGTPAANFAGGKYTAVTLTDDVTLYRGGDSNGKALGQWFTTEAPTSVAQVRIDTAVKPQ